MEPHQYTEPDTWLPMVLHPKYVEGRCVGVTQAPIVFLHVGPIPFMLTLEFAETILAELASVVTHLRVLHRANQEKN